MGSKIEEHHVKKERSWFYYLNLLIGSYLGIKDINDGLLNSQCAIKIGPRDFFLVSGHQR